MKFYAMWALIVGLLSGTSVVAQPELDLTFNTTGKRVESGLGHTQDVIAQPDNKIVLTSVCGNAFGVFPFCLLRLNEDGTPDTNFGSNGDGYVVTSSIFGPFTPGDSFGLALQSDGKIIAVGHSTFFGPNEDLAMVRYESDGSIDSSFGTGGVVRMDVIPGNYDRGKNVVIQPDGKIVIVGHSKSDSPNNFRLFVSRHLGDGTLDSTFGSAGITIITISKDASWGESISLQSDGKILVGGGIISPPGSPSPVASHLIARLNSDGSLDTGWDGDGIKSIVYGTVGFPAFNPFGIRKLAVQTDGRIMALGHDNVLYRFNSDGSPDTGFGTDGSRAGLPTSLSSEDALDFAISANGKITVVGESKTPPGFDYEYAIARYTPSGAPDLSFSGDGHLEIDVASSKRDGARAIAFDSTGRAVIGGRTAQGTVQNPWTNPQYSIVRLVAELNVSQAAPFDFDGDFKTDISIFRPSLGQWWYLRSSDLDNRAFAFGTSADKLVPADYTGDGKTDIAFWRESSGEWFVLRSEDSSFFAFPFGTNGDIPVPGDFDGDGKADAAVFRPSTATWYIQRSSDNGTTIQGFGIAEDKPTIDDFDGDGKADIAIFRPSVSEWWQLRSSEGVVAYQFGAAGDKTVPGDYTGDGKADLAFFRPSIATWFVWRSENDSYYSVPFGNPTDIPTPGDYDGDGKADTAVFRPSNNTWYVQGSTSGFFQTGFGQTGDVPVPNAYVGP